MLSAVPGTCYNNQELSWQWGLSLLLFKMLHSRLYSLVGETDTMNMQLYKV